MLSFTKCGLIFKLLTSSSLLFLGLVFSDALANSIINRPELTYLVRIAVFLVLFNGLLGTVSSTLVGLGDMRGVALLSIIQRLVKGILSPSLIVLGFSALGAVVGHVVSYVLKQPLRRILRR